MNVQEYVPADLSVVIARRVIPRLLFLTGCLFAVLTVIPTSAVGEVPVGQLGAGSFALGFAINAGNRVSERRYLRAVPSVLLAVGVSFIMLGAIELINTAMIAQSLMVLYLVWLAIGGMTEIGIKQDEDPIKEGAMAGKSASGGSFGDGGGGS